MGKFLLRQVLISQAETISEPKDYVIFNNDTDWRTVANPARQFDQAICMQRFPYIQIRKRVLTFHIKRQFYYIF